MKKIKHKKIIFQGNIYKKKNQVTQGDKKENIFIPLAWCPIIFSFAFTPIFFIIGGDDLDSCDDNNIFNFVSFISLIFIPLGLLLSFFSSFFIFFEKNRKAEAVLLLCVCGIIFPIFFIFSAIVFTSP